MTPNEAKLRQLADKLLAFTRKERLKWEDTADENTFRLLLDSGMIEIQERPKGDQANPTTSADQHQPVEYVLIVSNENNIPVQTISAEDLGTGSLLLRELYAAARESALRPSQLLDKIDSEISRLAETGRRR